MTDTPKITNELLIEWDACNEGLEKFNGLMPNGEFLEKAMKTLIDAAHDDYAYWLFCKCDEMEIYKSVITSGYLNSGNLNSGYRNSGGRNSGDRNSGYRNSGDRNSGDLNSGDYNVGFFNTKTPSAINVFDKPCDRDTWDSAYKPDFLWFSIVEWVYESDMSAQEKIDNPKFFTANGYLKTIGYKEAFKNAWDKADPNDRIKIKDLPNFNSNTFFEISGIEIKD